MRQITSERDCQLLRAEIEAERDRRIEEIQKHAQKELEAVDLVWRRLESNNGAQPATSPDTKGGSATTIQPPPPISLADGVRRAIRILAPQSRFNINTIIRVINERNINVNSQKPINPTSVSGILKKLAKDHEIRVYIAGAGKRATVYQKPDAPKQ